MPFSAWSVGVEAQKHPKTHRVNTKHELNYIQLSNSIKSQILYFLFLQKLPPLQISKMPVTSIYEPRRLISLTSFFVSTGLYLDKRLAEF
jgi:hypothetical protein